ncbi:MAG: transcription termination factor Rho, partial [Solirubrobacterales bacterium]|nr:transcription termination factor Rho [Solirubrobacterales bacterium]
MSVLTRSSLEGSPLADLHVLAAELGLVGYRKLRKADLIQAVLEAQPGGAPAEEEVVLEEGTTDEDAPKPRTRRRGGRGRTRDADPDTDEDDAPAPTPVASDDIEPYSSDEDERPARRRTRGGRNRGGAAGEERNGGGRDREPR